MDLAALESCLTSLKRTRARGGILVASREGAVDRYEVMLFAPATDQQIASAQTVLGRSLPEDFVAFWRFSDGANLFVNESGMHGVGIASTDMLSDLQKEEYDFYGPEALRNYVVFARVNGAGDFLVFDVATGRILDGIHAEQPHEWRVIAGSFTQWLQELIKSQGRYYWIEALYETAEL